ELVTCASVPRISKYITKASKTVAETHDERVRSRRLPPEPLGYRRSQARCKLSGPAPRLYASTSYHCSSILGRQRGFWWRDLFFLRLRWRRTAAGRLRGRAAARPPEQTHQECDSEPQPDLGHHPRLLPLMRAGAPANGNHSHEVLAPRRIALARG